MCVAFKLQSGAAGYFRSRHRLKLSHNIVRASSNKVRKDRFYETLCGTLKFDAFRLSQNFQLMNWL